ncbi:MAG: hypothetical protein M1812_001358 [Candelaria pacifica]|nr:MAG: hypothetical protein M1812_001358 [Candelaria pacifica]
MASSNRDTPAHISLKDKLAAALPKDAQFTLYHVSSPPTRCPAIFSAPPNSKPERTYCESHFCSVAIESSNDSKKLLVFAIEILIYTTANLTTLFVSKADSTGYLHFLELPKGTASPFKAISTAIISYLVETRQRPGIRLVVSLFARAQDQYLFPGSIENQRKHVLSDRGLVKWWCQVLDPVIKKHPTGGIRGDSTDVRAITESDITSQGYVIVPGFDRHETSWFFPRSVGADQPDQKKWLNSHPLWDISNNPTAPPRCLVPHFPDDPKARFLDELDDEIPDISASQVSDSPSKRGKTGEWRSVRNLEQFWETMAFRQECSSGRLVGFIWVVFTPENLSHKDQDIAVEDSQSSNISSLPRYDEDETVVPNPLDSPLTQELPATPTKSQASKPTTIVSTSPSASYPSSRQRNTELPSSQSSLASKASKSLTRSRKLRGPIKPRQPRVKTAKSSRNHIQPAHSEYYVWPTTSRGQLVVGELDYKRVNDLLLRLDFCDEEAASNSTRRWIDEVGIAAGTTQTWGYLINGERETCQAHERVPAATGTLNQGLIRRKRKSSMGDAVEPAKEPSNHTNMLTSTLVRKKPKANGYDNEVTAEAN